MFWLTLIAHPYLQEHEMERKMYHQVQWQKMEMDVWGLGAGQGRHPGRPETHGAKGCWEVRGGKSTSWEP